MHNLLGGFSLKKLGFLAVTIAAFGVSVGSASAGGYHHKRHHHHHPTPPPVVVPVVPRGENSVFLCNGSSPVPFVVSEPAAKALVGTNGNVEAQAVAGNVEGGNNVGSFHLVCGATGTNTGQSVDTGGFVYGVGFPAATESVGFYFIYV